MNLNFPGNFFDGTYQSEGIIECIHHIDICYHLVSNLELFFKFQKQHRHLLNVKEKTSKKMMVRCVVVHLSH
jgi:hypothetical protein